MPEEEENNQGSDETEYSYGSDFLSNLGTDVTDEQRALIEPLIKKWDAGITRRFQELQGELSQYEPLKEAEISTDDLESLIYVNHLLENDPKELFKVLKEAGVEFDETPTPPVGKTESEGSNTPIDLPPEIQARIDQLEQLVTLLAEGEVSKTQTAQEQEDQKQLDNYIDLMHKEFGDFNDEYVVFKLGQGLNAEDAFKAWKELAGPVNQDEGKKPPVVLSGAGGPPVPEGDVRKLNRADTQSLVIKFLENAQKG